MPFTKFKFVCESCGKSKDTDYSSYPISTLIKENMFSLCDECTIESKKNPDKIYSQSISHRILKE